MNAALQQMTPLKSQGPNSFSACFYQSYWHIVSEKICFIALKHLNDGVFDSKIEFTYIFLILKKSNPFQPCDFRSIRLFNVIYKHASKVLANRLKKLLPVIISPTQSFFILGCLIFDNIIVTYETLLTMKSQHKSKENTMAIKLEISKEYDWVKWPFLEAMMRSLGFSER